MLPLRIAAGTTVGHYELLQPIGAGGAGVVYEAVHRSLGRRVAIKLLHSRVTDKAQSDRAAERFVREGRAAAQVRHPHVVDVFDFGVDDGVAFLVMELVQGETLAQLLKRETKLPIDCIAETLLPILSAVGELHAAGIVHRDIKPENILLARGHEIYPKLTDFGLSRLDDGPVSFTDSRAIIGTPEYMSPELTDANRNATERSDQYAIGVILYECVSGRKPFVGANIYELLRAVSLGEFVPPSSYEASIPRAFEDLVLRAMNRQPEGRFGSVDELGEALLPFASARVAARWRDDFDSMAHRADAAVDTSEPAFAQTKPSSAPAVSGKRSRVALATFAGASTVVALSLGAAARHPHTAAPSTVTARGDESSIRAMTAASPAVQEPVAPLRSADSIQPVAQLPLVAPTAKAMARAMNASRPAPSLNAASARVGPSVEVGTNESPILEVP